MKRWMVLAAVLGGLVGAAVWWSVRDRTPAGTLTLYGNVDLRQVSLAFNGSERIATVLVEEGDRVHAGQLLATLDTRRLEPQVAQAEAQVAAQRAVVEKLHHGSRPEEIARARANLTSAKADAADVRLRYQRLKTLQQRDLASRQDVDSARAAAKAADARVEVAQKNLDLELAGPRQEDIAEAQAQLDARQAAAQLLRQQLDDARLTAPVDGVIRARLLEAGDMASPQRPVFSLALMDPKWIRAYVSETDLGRVSPGLSASVAVDAFPEQRFSGQVGFVSPVAEFTPKTVETEALRTSLVYEVRVLVDDPADRLRLGMPATVYLPVNPAVPDTAGRAAPAAAP